MKNVVAVVVVIAIGLAFLAGLGSSTYIFRGSTTSGSTSTSTISTTSSAMSTTSSAMSTTCIVPYGTNGYIFYCSDPLRISAVSETNGETWNYTASISTDSVAAGQPILLVASLTNIAGEDQTVKEFVKPFINPGVYDTKGTEVWAWNPPQSTWPNMTVTNGETISQNVTIPTSGLSSGQSYFIEVQPLSIQIRLMSGGNAHIPILCALDSLRHFTALSNPTKIG